MIVFTRSLRASVHTSRISTWRKPKKGLWMQVRSNVLLDMLMNILEKEHALKDTFTGPRSACFRHVLLQPLL